MEETHRTHKEPAWGWLGAVRAGLARRPGKPTAPVKAGGVTRPRSAVTPWSPRSPAGWSA